MILFSDGLEKPAGMIAERMIILSAKWEVYSSRKRI
jgi:hypothetical protein